ncbi:MULTISPECIES: PspC domain-containing protein [unclassified Paenibacillus]|uniref:PspC domain-containing protein n=1 Tax=unclassified Paenibacillus TaxID=185978 RepID=UPI001C0F87C5|nr:MULTISPECIES: PspC domain-containing protein [unclassified Paenibacillus]MBU5441367.1 PspC domain-containing protein [Paenibacillus sp. MSJ-34]CAH0118232.1 hypothetical protein PAE9249_00716 [Paenibacillus sp. CECT 9249]
MTKLYRSNRDKTFTGLCGGLAEMLGMDSTLIRVLVVILTVFTGGTVLFIYIVASLVVPKEPTYPPFGPFGPGPGPGYGSNGFHGYNHNKYGGYGNQGPVPPNGPFGPSYGPRPQGPSGFGTNMNAGGPVNGSNPANASPIDAAMEDIEKKALKKELEELRAKVAKYEKGDV